MVMLQLGPIAMQPLSVPGAALTSTPPINQELQTHCSQVAAVKAFQLLQLHHPELRSSALHSFSSSLKHSISSSALGIASLHSRAL